MTIQQTAAERVRGAYRSRTDDIRAIVNGEAGDDLPQDIAEYGLSIDRVEAGTFEGQRAPYTRYQISFGGPSEEYRVYDNGDVEFWFKDWFDGASVPVTGNDADLIREIVNPE